MLSWQAKKASIRYDITEGLWLEALRDMVFAKT
jgi:hypothetical protein